MDPRGFTLPRSALNKVGSGASFWLYSIYLWDVHFADLHNDAAIFAKSAGDGAFSVTHPGPKARRKAIQTAGKNRFGGVMQLLGSYGDNEGYLNFSENVTTVFYYDWLFNYLGHGGQATADGVVTAGFVKSHKNYNYTRSSGARGTSTVYAEVFKWTTGSVTVTALGGTFSTILRRKGYDHRTAMGSGAIQLVSPMLTRWVSVWGESSTASIGVLKLTFAPEPTSLLMLGAGATLVGLIFQARRRARGRARRATPDAAPALSPVGDGETAGEKLPSS